jgi:hypothetical protein
MKVCFALSRFVLSPQHSAIAFACNFRTIRTITHKLTMRCVHTDSKTSREKTKVRLRWHGRRQARNSSKETEKEINELFVCAAGSGGEETKSLLQFPAVDTFPTHGIIVLCIPWQQRPATKENDERTCYLLELDGRRDGGSGRGWLERSADPLHRRRGAWLGGCYSFCHL